MIESATGKTWEELALGLKGIPGRTAGAVLSESSSWNELAALLPSSLLEAEVATLGLPTRMANFCVAWEIVTVRELVDLRRGELEEQPNLGDRSVDDTLSVLLDRALHPEIEPEHPSAHAALRFHVSRLDSALRNVLVRRMGLHGRSQKLREIGESLGVTRERVRQIEARAIAVLRRDSRWIDGLRDRLFDSVNRSVVVEDLAQDPWWKDLVRDEETLVYFLNRILEANLHVVHMGETRLVSALGQKKVDRVWRIVLSEIKANGQPGKAGDMDNWLEPQRSTLGDGLVQAIKERLSRSGAVGEGSSLPGSEGDRTTKVLAYLSAQESPVPIEQVYSVAGPGVLPDEVLYFARGVVGLRKHFPGFEEWLRVVPTACAQVMEEADPDRQWHVRELVEALRETDCIPESFTHWNVASLLRCSEEVDYLGGLRVALTQETDAPSRVLYSATVAEAIGIAGEPTSLDRIAEGVKREVDVDPATIGQTLKGPEFIQVEEGRWGLVARDLPGGERAAENLRDLVADSLEERQHGMTPHQLWVFASGEEEFAGWSRSMVYSIVRADPRFRIASDGGVGLRLWESSRTLSPLDLLESALGEDVLVLSADTIKVQVEDLTGDRPGDGLLSKWARQLGATLSDGEIIRAQSPETKEMPSTDEDELHDPAPRLYTLDEIHEILARYKAPAQPSLDLELAEQVMDQVRKTIEYSSYEELALIEKYAMENVRALQQSDVPWMRELGAAAAAMRQLQVLERFNTISLDEITLRHIRAGLFYMVDRDDVIPDETPTIGFLDDAHAIAWCARVISRGLRGLGAETD